MVVQHLRNGGRIELVQDAAFERLRLIAVQTQGTNSNLEHHVVLELEHHDLADLAAHLTRYAGALRRSAVLRGEDPGDADGGPAR